MTDKQKRDELIETYTSTDEETIQEIITEYDTWLRGEAIKIIGWYLSVDVPKLTPNEIGELQSRIRTAGKEKV